jgi:hypothetical protein
MVCALSAVNYIGYVRELTHSLQDIVMLFLSTIINNLGTAVAQWLRCCATNRKIAGLIPDGVLGIFH